MRDARATPASTTAPPPPILLISTLADRELVAQCCEQSLAAGVRPGMTLAHARALLPVRSAVRTPDRRPVSGLRRGSLPAAAPAQAPHIEPFAPHRDLAALRHLAAWATRFCPTVAVDPQFTLLLRDGVMPHTMLRASALSLAPGLLLDVTGCERLYRGEHHLLRRLCEAVARLGIRCRAAIAPTFGCAWAVARFGSRWRDIIAPGAVLEALRPLPVSALRIDGEIEAALAEVAIDRVGHIIDLPRAALPSRFGDDLLLRLDQALGRAMETIDPVRVEPPPCVEVLFTGPTTRFEAVALATRQLVNQLAPLLHQRESGARQIDLELIRAEIEPLRITVAFSHPTRDAKHIASLLAPQLERAHLGHGVDRILLTASRLGRLRHEQLEEKKLRGKGERGEGTEEGRDGGKEIAVSSSLRPSAPSSLCSSSPFVPSPEHLGRMLDVLTHRLGEERVLRVEAVESHQPQHAFRYRPVTAPAAVVSREPAMIAADRPSLLFDPPEPADVMAITPDGPPSWLRWRGEARRVLSAAGPLRIAGPWWKERGEPMRDYFRIADECGRWLWVCRDMVTRRWFVGGQWV